MKDPKKMALITLPIGSLCLCLSLSVRMSVRMSLSLSLSRRGERWGREILRPGVIEGETQTVSSVPVLSKKCVCVCIFPRVI